MEQDSGSMADIDMGSQASAQPQYTAEPTKMYEHFSEKLELLTAEIKRPCSLPDMLKSLEKKIIQESADMRTSLKIIEDETKTTTRTSTDCYHCESTAKGTPC